MVIQNPGPGIGWHRLASAGIGWHRHMNSKAKWVLLAPCLLKSMQVLHKVIGMNVSQARGSVGGGNVIKLMVDVYKHQGIKCGIGHIQAVIRGKHVSDPPENLVGIGWHRLASAGIGWHRLASEPHLWGARRLASAGIGWHRLAFS